MPRTTSHGRHALAAVCGLALAFAPAQAADARLGDLDPSFDGDGIATPNVGTVGGEGAELEAMTVRLDGRVVAAGWADNPTGLDEALLVQLTGGGAPDTGFGATGAGLTRIATTVAETRLHGVAVDGAGRVLAAASRLPSSTAQVLPLALRFSATGSPDTSFLGTIGSTRGEARAVVPVGDGALVAGWRGPTTTGEGLFVAKLTAEGGLDPNFGGGDGIADIPLGAQSRGHGLAVDAQNRIVVAGWRSIAVGNGSVQQAVLARLEPDGDPDGTFGAGGVVDVSPVNPDGAQSGELHAVQIDGLGRIVVAGRSGRHAFVARRLDGGAPDTTFGTGGATFGTLPEFAELSALALDGARTIVAGRTFGNAPDQILLGSLDATGAAEPALGGAPAGWRTFPSPMAGGAEALGATMGAGGAAYTAGALHALNEQRTPFVSRHLPNGAPIAALAALAGATAGTPVLFDAGGSSDPEGEALRFAFDLDGDGSYEFDGGGNPFAARSFPAPGTYTVGVRVTDPRGASATAARTVAVTAAPVPPPQPELGKQGVARPIRGIVRVRLPGTKRFVRITELTAIPNGTEIDVRKGRILITVLHDAGGRLDAARFYAGRFFFKQGKGATPITTLKLSGGSFRACRATNGKARRSVLAVASRAAGERRKRIRRLWGDGRGRFRTRGKYGAATVRGTKWLTQDRCDGTRIKVVRGKVDATDLVRPKRKRKRVAAGEAILIRKAR